MDPAEWLGTAEHLEEAERRKLYREMLLDIAAEQMAEERLQYPYRFSH